MRLRQRKGNHYHCISDRWRIDLPNGVLTDRRRIPGRSRTFGKSIGICQRSPGGSKKETVFICGRRRRRRSGISPGKVDEGPRNDADVIVGSKNKDLLILEKEMEEAAGTLYVTTDDGSYGRKRHGNGSD